VTLGEDGTTVKLQAVSVNKDTIPMKINKNATKLPINHFCYVTTLKTQTANP